MARAPLVAQMEDVPEADRLEGFPHPRMTAALFGHAAAEAAFAEALSSNIHHHAWLITGTEGIGKATFAYRVARAALARPDERGMFGTGLDVDPDTAAYRQVTSLSHPGLVVIRRAFDQKSKRFSATISVDDVRRLKAFLALSAEEGGRRVVIVDSADDMNVNAANALLKSLEEPPPRTIFLLIASAPGRLLPTIRSRCRTLPLSPLGHGDLQRAVAAALQAAGKPPIPDADFAALEALSGGSVRRLLALQEGGGLVLQAKIDKVLASLPTGDLKAAHMLSDELAPAAAEQKFTLFYELFLGTLQRLIKAEATGLASEADLGRARRLIGPQRLATFAGLWETLARDKADVLALNLDRKALIMSALAKLETASRS
ncbi:MAG: DNA polymerase III subunit delta' [Hyphomicrobium sp.]|nr:DNA polymerase III subunit delta' [Hyphomicrobium sp.]